MTARTTFKQADVTRAVRGAVAAGLTVSRVEIDQAGRIVLHIAHGDTSSSEMRTKPLDRLLRPRG